MPDRTFSSAYGYDKAHPVFNFVFDSAIIGPSGQSGAWRPYSTADAGGMPPGTTPASAQEQVITNSLLTSISGNVAPAQSYPFYIRSAGASTTTISQQLHSFTFSNIGSGNATIGGKILAPYETVSYDFGKDYGFAPAYNSVGTVLAIAGTSSDATVSSL